MAALFPRPKCKFGRNDLVVDATYVLCTSSPTAIEELEGRHGNKVSLTVALVAEKESSLVTK